MKKVLFLFVIIMFPILLFADSSMYLADYNVEVNVSKKARHEITEDLTFNYLTSHHGFYRNIPLKFSQVVANVVGLSCSENFSTDRDSGYLVIKVGDADRTVKGLKDYKLSYTYVLSGDLNDGYDEFYFNIIGSGWDINIEKSHFKIIFPEGTSLDKVWITRGQYGETNQQGINWTVTNNVIEGDALNFSPQEAMTIRVELPDGWYTVANPIEIAKRSFIILIILSVIAVFLAWFIWNRKGRDKKLIIVPQFTPPENFSPLEVGFLADMRVDNKDVTSLLFYWADKGYLKIEEIEKNKYKFIKLKNLSAKDSSNQQKILFDSFFVEDEITSDTLDGKKFMLAMSKASSIVLKKFKKETPIIDSKSNKFTFLVFITALLPLFGLSILVNTGKLILSQVLFTTLLFAFSLVLEPIMVRVVRKYDQRKIAVFSFITSFIVVFIILTIVSLIISYSYVDDYLLVSCIIAAVAQNFSMFFAAITPRRTEYGQETIEKVLGFRDFIETVEIDKLKLLVDEDPEFFYKILSYAIVYGLEKKWAKKFESLTIEEPSWYTGHTLFNPLFVPVIVNSINTNFNPSMSEIKSSQGFSSGMGSSGFSGGGFGGGGGGGW